MSSGGRWPGDRDGEDGRAGGWTTVDTRCWLQPWHIWYLRVGGKHGEHTVTGWGRGGPSRDGSRTENVGSNGAVYERMWCVGRGVQDVS